MGKQVLFFGIRSTGSEIHEAVITLLVLDCSGIDAQIMAPDMDLFHGINHYLGKALESERNIFVEPSTILREE